VAPVINLRFHIVSLVAVFFALAIGIAVGATVVDQGVLTQTQRRITQLDGDLRDRDREIRSLRAERKERERVVAALEPFARSAGLAGADVVVLRAPEVRSDGAEIVEAALRNGGASVRRLSLRSSALDPSPVELSEIQELLANASARPELLRYLLHDRLAQSMFDPFAAPNVAPLLASPFVREIDGDNRSSLTFARGSLVVLLVGDRGPDATLWESLVERLSARGAGRVALVHVSEAADDERLFGAGTSRDDALGTVLVGALRGNRTRADVVASLDSIDGVAGRTGIVAVVADLRNGRVGHFGTRPDAQRLLPRR
jgi:hypothetical protein